MTILSAPSPLISGRSERPYELTPSIVPAWYLDAFFDRREGGVEVIGGMHKWVMPCNWKFPAENFGGDGYHTSWSHLSAIQTGSGGDFRVNPDPNGVMLSPGNGHRRYAGCVARPRPKSR